MLRPSARASTLAAKASSEPLSIAHAQSAAARRGRAARHPPVSRTGDYDPCHRHPATRGPRCSAGGRSRPRPRPVARPTCTWASRTSGRATRRRREGLRFREAVAQIERPHAQPRTSSRPRSCDLFEAALAQGSAGRRPHPRPRRRADARPGRGGQEGRERRSTHPHRGRPGRGGRRRGARGGRRRGGGSTGGGGATPATTAFRRPSPAARRLFTGPLADQEQRGFCRDGVARGHAGRHAHLAGPVHPSSPSAARPERLRPTRPAATRTGRPDTTAGRPPRA